MAKRVNSGLPFERWPLADRRLWQSAFSNTDIFADGSVAGLKPTTLYGRLAAYRQWLGYVEAAAPELLALLPHQRVTLEAIEDYVGHLRQNCRETTVGIEIQRLYLVMRVLCPSHDWAWVNRICRRIFRGSRAMRHPEVQSPELYRLGLFLMDTALEKAEHQKLLTRSCAIRYRDGLLIAFLVEAPVRRAALARLLINRHLSKIGQHWYVNVPAELTKTKTPQDYTLSVRLSHYVDTYIAQIRPAFSGADTHSSFWPFIGRPMTDRMIWRRVIRRTRDGLGIAVPPHRFRNAAATFLTLQDPANAFAARDLLGHKSLTMTKKHYVDRAQSRIAGQQLSSIIQKIKTNENSETCAA